MIVSPRWKKKMKQLELQRRYESEKIDLTLPADETGIGNLHPITLVRNQLIDIFAGMGFEIYEGAEIENDYYNFTALNTPKDHPARDMQDTFYLSPELLAFHFRPPQVRFMLWRARSRRSRFYLQEEYSVLMMMRLILQCSIKWRDLLSIRELLCLI